MKTEIFGVRFDAFTTESAAVWALEAMEKKCAAVLCTPNAETVWQCRKNDALERAINGADAVVPDGSGVLWASRVLKRPFPARAAGMDVLTEILSRMEGRVFLLGGRPGVAEKAAEVIEKTWPRVTVCGTHHGYFEEDEDVLRLIRGAEPELLAVCLGVPKQELWMARYRGTLPVGVMAGLGGSLDVLAGEVRRAPRWMQSSGLEWLWRLLQEPKRWKRQLCLPRFVLAVLAERIKL